MLNKSFTINEIINLIDSCGKNSVLDTKRIYENLQDALLSKIKNLSSKNLSDILHAIARYNLTEEYETNPFYIQFLLKFNEHTLKELENEIPQLAWTLSLFALRVKEFNPMLQSALTHVLNYLDRRQENVSIFELMNILQSLAVAELMMKYNLTKLDLRKYFDQELISVLLNQYVHRIAMEPNMNLIRLQRVLERREIVAEAYTNLSIGIKLSYKDKTLPVVLIDSNSLNMDGKLKGEDFITYYHMKSYTGINPMIIDVSKIENRLDFEAEYQKYLKHPQTLYRKMLE